MLEEKIQYIRQFFCFTNSTNDLMCLSNLLRHYYSIIMNYICTNNKVIV